MSPALLIFIVSITGFWSVDATVYYGFDGYSKFPSANDNLSKANESISFEFKFCQTDGILLYATDEERVLYFAIGVYQSRILLEFDLGDSLREIITDSTLQANTWYNITITGLAQDSSNTQLYVDGSPVSKSGSPFDSVDFSVLNGPLYIGGHSNPLNIDANRLRCTLDACIASFGVGSVDLDLLSVGENTEQGCPNDHCQIKNSITFSSPSSLLALPSISQGTQSYFKLQLEFQTSLSNGLLMAMTDESSLIIYLVDGRVAVTYDRGIAGFSEVNTMSTNAYSDSQQHYIRVIFDDGRLTLTVDNDYISSVDTVTQTYIQSDSIWLGGTNLTLPSYVPVDSSVALRGCMYNIAFTNNGILQLVDTTMATVQELVTLDDCIVEDTCHVPCSKPSEKCIFECVCEEGFLEVTNGSCIEIDECESSPCLFGATCIDNINDYSCTCTLEYNKGKNCDIPNSCFPDPCQNGGNCTDYDVGYLCSCAEGWNGLNCTNNIPDCEPESCKNGGVCIDVVNGFVCDCASGYTGETCEIDIDECASDPCMNGATCKDFINSIQCTCALGYTGAKCEIDIDDCDNDPCFNGATCVDGPGNFTCMCPPGFMGMVCDEDINECYSNPCFFNGTCVNLVNGFDCICPPGLTGEQCLGDIQECLIEEPCLNEGKCIEKVGGGYECYCKAGWIGDNCESSYDECSSNPCLHGAECLDGHLTYTCVCPPGYTGTNCEVDIYECASNPCYNNGTCIDIINDYFCWCPSGFQGLQCEIELGTCDSSPCENEATCMNTESGFTCTCLPGYTGNLCEDNINECDVYSPCDNDATCTDLVNDYTCSCPVGYEGKNCSVDTNDCETNPCFFSGTCIDKVNGFECICPVGIQGSHCEISVNECVTNPCPNEATCVELDINGYLCQCPVGLVGVSCESDIDECIDSPCQFGGICLNSFGSYSCQCPNGTEGYNCEIDIDECQSQTCENGGTCFHGLNNFTCVCQPGYVGTFCEEGIDNCATLPCVNGGSCVNLVDDYMCLCLPIHTGKECQTEFDVCDTFSPCENEGSCIEHMDINSNNILDYYTCVCPNGYTDQNCSTNIDDCQSNPCLHGAICIDGVADYSCQCSDGLTGDICQSLLTFTVTNSNSYLSVPVSLSYQTDISFIFATTLSNGILIYSRGIVTDDYLGDFLALELIEGSLLFKYDTGGGFSSNKELLLGNNLNDGQQHHVSFQVNETGSMIFLDSNNCTSDVLCFGETWTSESETSFFSSDLFIGGSSINDNATMFHLQSDSSLISTISYFKVNQSFIEYADVKSDGISLSNLRSGDPCINSQCVNGVCEDLWLSSECNCNTYYYEGDFCSVLTTSHLDGNSVLSFNRNINGDIVFESSFNEDSGLVLGIIESGGIGQMFLLLDNFQLRLYLFSNDVSVITDTILAEPLDNGAWYTFSVHFDTASVTISIKSDGDRCSDSICQLIAVYPSNFGHFSLPFSAELVFGDFGSYLNFSQQMLANFPVETGIVGCLRNLLLFENSTIQSLDEGFSDLYPSEPGCPREDVCFPNPCENSGICVSSWSSYSCQCTSAYTGPNCTEDASITLFGSESSVLVVANTQIQFLEDTGSINVKTLDTNGIIYHGAWYLNGELTGEYITVEVFNSSLQISTAIGNNDITLETSLLINSGQEHTISWSIVSTDNSETEIMLQVDESSVTSIHPLQYVRGQHDQLQMSIGGHSDINDVQSQSQDYFRACVNGLIIDNNLIPLLLSVQPFTVSNFNTQSGCLLDSLCSTDPCPANATACTNLFDTYECTGCPIGYGGNNCDILVEPCTLGPCENGATCIDSPSLSCICPPSYTGTFCAESINPCAIDPCSNNGSCIAIDHESYNCSCMPGYTGGNCEVEVNECEPNPCSNNDTCTDFVNDYECDCLPGYTGKSCSINIQDCFMGACINGGTCVDGIASYTCNCIIGFTGNDCSINMDDCATNPCLNEGTCIDGINGYQCACNEWYTGNNCETLLPACELDVCFNGGTCSDTLESSGLNDLIDSFSGDFPHPLSFDCICPSGYTGSRCEIKTMCLPNPCFNNGTCVDNVNDTFICHCPETHNGDFCETLVNPCIDILEPDYCNNGTCEFNGMSITCNCDLGYTGLQCETDIDDCIGHDCQNGSTCIDQIDSFMCQCPVGFTGQKCEINIDDCLDTSCENGATCIDDINGFTCMCPAGYTGITCEIEINECSDDPCENGATCIDDINGFICICPAGYTGITCEIEINECSDDPCENDATCIDDINGFICICPAGYTGITCIIQLGDHCSPNPCMNNGSCVPQEGSGSNNAYLTPFICACPPGFTGSFCESTDPCDPNPCYNGASCMNTDNSSFYCECRSGYTGDFCEQIIDFCSDSDSINCLNGGSCINTPDGPYCMCPPEVTGPLCSIDNVDSCENDPCINGNCTDHLMIGFDCDCFIGYSGEFCETDIDDCDGVMCLNNGTCVDDINDYMCDCASDWTGLNCETSVNYCEDVTCMNGGTCLNVPGGFKCNCSEDYMGMFCNIPLHACIDDPCLNNGTCTPQPEPVNYTCTCPTGFTGELCEDIFNPCEPNPCQDMGTCNIIDNNSYICDCKPGMTGLNCDILDFCFLDGDQCKNDATCINDQISMKVNCSCLEGYYGEYCQYVNECLLYTPCSNGGFCNDTLAAYTCSCLSGYTGDNCENDFNECSLSPCTNGGTCIDSSSDGSGSGSGGILIGEYTCICPQLYSGFNCEIFIDPCESYACYNGGSCILQNGGILPECLCDSEYTGQNCETHVCDLIQCFNGGYCAVANGGSGNGFIPILSTECVCLSNFTGPFCENEIIPDPCLDNMCDNGATCVSNSSDYECICPMDFTGPFCENEIIPDPCLDNMCDNGATCVSNSSDYECICPMDFTGPFCENEIIPDPCLDNMCDNGATCVSNSSDYECICKMDFTGPFCENEIIPDPCLDNMCDNGATCVSNSSDYECICPMDFTGPFCENEIIPDPCLDNMCDNGATCVSNSSDYECICKMDFTGPFCENEIIPDPCLDNMCDNGATCVSNSSDYECICPMDFTGPFCENEIIPDPCLDNMCDNGATCVSNSSDYECICKMDFTGPFCENEIIPDPCLDNMCDNGATCVSNSSDYECICKMDFTGPFCENEIIPDPCLDNMCDNGATCVSNSSDYECICSMDFTGPFCENEIITDPCLANPCDTGATCLSNGSEYQCICPFGLTGITCSDDIDECFNDPCLNNGTCIESSTAIDELIELGFIQSEDQISSGDLLNFLPPLGEFDCICPEGYEGDFCEMVVSGPCDDPPCMNGGICFDDGNGEFECQCPPFYTGDLCESPYSPCDDVLCQNNGTCEVVGVDDYRCSCQPLFYGNFCQYQNESQNDPCLSEPCQNNGTCVTSVNDTEVFSCVCDLDYTGDTCGEKIDLCMQQSPCLNNGTCEVVDGNITCICSLEYTDGICSTQIDNCLDNSCMNGGTCLDLFDDFECMCVNGFSGDFCQEDIDECVNVTCVNNGVCIESGTNFTLVLPPSNFVLPGPGEMVCVCPNGFIGDLCEAVDTCLPMPCLDNATCIPYLNETFSCDCIDGFEGDICQNDTDECSDPYPCLNSSICVESSTTIQSLQEIIPELPNSFVVPDVDLGEYVCICQNGYSGMDCEISACMELDPCVNGGTCALDDFGEQICLCLKGYEGDNCQLDKNECLDQPCMNNGICLESNTTVPDEAQITLPNIGEFMCMCQGDFIGMTCAVVDPCAISPCTDSSTCIADEIDGTFECLCPPGFKGDTCSINITTTACYNNSCMNNGSCIDSSITQDELDDLDINITLSELPEFMNNDVFFCLCTPQFTGQMCDVMLGPCDEVPCENGGTCIIDDAEAICICPNGTMGDNCETDINECNPNPCMNQGMCLESGTDIGNVSEPIQELGDYSCFCQPGYTGDNCDVIVVDPCDTSPCINGTCETIGSEYSCICDLGFTGMNCDVNIDDCAVDPCMNGTCVDLIDGYQCDCSPGYTDTNCSMNIDDCDPDPCVNGDCIDLVNDIMCECFDGYSGGNCQNDTNECDSNPCLNDGICIESGTTIESLQQINPLILDNFTIPDVSVDNFTCICNENYSGDICEDIITCVEDGNCVNGGVCGLDEFNNNKCMCSNGYDGSTCQNDVNECSTDPQVCQNNGICIESGTTIENLQAMYPELPNIFIPTVGIGNFTCLCPPNYSGDMCETFLSCAELDPCLNEGTCSFDKLDNKICICTTAFTGNSCEVDVNECLEGTHQCNLTGGICMNSIGSYNCLCKDGYTGNVCDVPITDCDPPCVNGNCQNLQCMCDNGYTGDTCSTDVDECEQDAAICNNGTCVNSIGEYSCSCDSGYSGPDCLLTIEGVEDDPIFSEGVIIGIIITILGLLIVVVIVVIFGSIIVSKRRYNKRHDSYNPAAIEKEHGPSTVHKVDREVYI